LRLGLRIVAYGDAFGARERRNQDIDLVLLHQFLGGTNRGVWACIRGTDDGFDLLAARLAAVRLFRQFVAAHAVLTENGVSAFKRRSDANPELVGSVRRSSTNERGEAGRGRNS